MVLSQEGPLGPLISHVTISLSQNRNNADSARTRSAVFRTSRDGREARRARRAQVPGTAVSAGTRRAPTADSSAKSGRRWTSGTGARSCCPSAWSPQGPGLRGWASLCLVSALALHPPRATGRVTPRPPPRPPRPLLLPSPLTAARASGTLPAGHLLSPPDRRERGRRTHRVIPPRAGHTRALQLGTQTGATHAISEPRVAPAGLDRRAGNAHRVRSPARSALSQAPRRGPCPG